MQKKTPLYKHHVDNGARMTDFHGWQLPLQFTSIIEECKNVRKSAGLFDISHMGKAEVKGPNALKLLQYLTTNDLAAISDGQAQYTALVNENCGIIDDMIVYRVGPNRYFLCLNAANTEQDINWLADQALQYPDVEVKDLSTQYGLLSFQGPSSETVLRNLVNIKLSSLKYFHFTVAQVAGFNVILSRTGYTGEDGFEIFCDRRDTVDIWEAILKKGKQSGAKPAGLGARDLLRLEMGYLLHGQDMGLEKNPYEAGLGWVVKPEKQGGYICRDLLEEQKRSGVKRKLAGFVMEEKAGVPRTGFSILAESRIVGEVTSGGMSPNLGKGIGMGYILAEYATPDTPIQIDIRGRAVAAKVAKRPFVKTGVKKPTEEKPERPAITGKP